MVGKKYQWLQWGAMYGLADANNGDCTNEQLFEATNGMFTMNFATLTAQGFLNRTGVTGKVENILNKKSIFLSSNVLHVSASDLPKY